MHSYHLATHFFEDVKLFASVLYFLLKLKKKKQEYFHGAFNSYSKGLNIHVGPSNISLNPRFL